MFNASSQWQLLNRTLWGAEQKIKRRRKRWPTCMTKPFKKHLFWKLTAKWHPQENRRIKDPDSIHFNCMCCRNLKRPQILIPNLCLVGNHCADEVQKPTLTCNNFPCCSIVVEHGDSQGCAVSFFFHLIFTGFTISFLCFKDTHTHEQKKNSCQSVLH